jgi:AcrR family transcriptional regulator
MTTTTQVHPGRRGGHARERLMEAADTLFYERGINTVGVAELVAHARVAKTSLYLHFDSKDALVEAYLAARVEKYIGEWREIIDGLEGASPEVRLDAVFGELADYVSLRTFSGCPFWKAVAELNDPSHPAWTSVFRYRRTLTDEVFLPIAQELGAARPELLAGQFVMLYDAALAGAFVDRTTEPVERARLACHALLEGARRTGLLV